jgi:Ras-related protein Rab-2A
MAKNIYDYMLKFIIVGDSSVGKSNLMLRFTDKRFQTSHDLTIGVEFGTKLISNQNKIYKLQIWDTAGQEAFRTITRSFYRGTVGCLLVYDITQRRTFESITGWLTELKSNCDPVMTIILIGNKIDSENKREVSTEQGKELADKNNIMFIETSAKTSQNVDACFQYLVSQVGKKIETGELGSIASNHGIKILTCSQQNQTTGWNCYC